MSGSRFLIMSVMLLVSHLVNSETIVVNTEEFSPLSYSKQGEIVGIATEQVKEIFLTANVDYTLQLLPWARAYNNALTDKNTCVYTTSNTPERTELFKWVEPLSLNTSILVALVDSPISVSSLEDAKQYRIGIQNEDVGADFLKTAQFPNLDQAPDVDTSLRKLHRNRIDMIAMAESRFNEMVKSGVKIKKVIDAFSIKMGLACNLSVSDEIINSLQTQLDQLIENGIQQRIIDKYTKHGADCL